MKRYLLTLLVICLVSTSAASQAYIGRIVGTVSSRDGVISGATIVITDHKTGRERTVTTGTEGAFTVPQLEVGTYTVKVSMTGFKAFTANDVKIDAGREYLLNITLEIGNVQESITVTAGTDVLNATTAELSSTVSPRQVLELPLNGRNPLGLVGLQPGAAPNRGNGSEIINGGRTSSTNFMRDGINVQDIFIRNGFVPDSPTVDNTGEFTVITQNAGAEIGYGSSQIQLVTPRGGKDFHGGLWLYNRNSKFTGNDYFNNAAGRFVATDTTVIQGLANVGDPRLPRPFLNRNQFGGKVGGPLWLPHFGQGGSSTVKDKAFFFFSYEKFLLRQQSPKTTTIFLPDARNGIFSYRPTNPGAITPGQCLTFTNGICTVNVLSGAGLTAAIPDASQGALPLDSSLQSRFLSQIPTSGNRRDIGDGLNTTGLSFNQSDPEDRNEYTSRVDVEINSRNIISGIFRYNKSIDARPDIDNTFNQSAQVRTEAPTKFFVLSWQSSLGKISNEVRGGFQLADLAFLNGVLPNQAFLIGGQGTITNPGLGLVTNPELNFRDQGRNTRSISFLDNATFTSGQHSFKFGGEYSKYKAFAFNQAGVGIPTYILAGVNNQNTPRLPANLFPGGINLSDQNNADFLRFLLGGVIQTGTINANVTSRTSGYVAGVPLNRDLRYDTTSFYINDQWHVRPSLILNFGLRYEFYTPLRSPDGLYLEPVLGNDAVGSVLNPNGTYDFVGRNSGNQNAFIKPDRDNFSPNFSFAYSPNFKNKLLTRALGDSRTVIRGGFRMGYVNDEYIRSIDNAVGQNFGLTATANALQQITPGSTPTNSLNARLSNVLQVAPPVAPNFITPPRSYADNNTSSFNRFGTVFGVDPKLQTPRTFEFNFGIQREIGFQTAIEVRYVGAFSNQMVRTIDFNQIDIRDNGFGADFIRAIQNERATRPQAGAPGTGNIFGTAACLQAAQCQPLTVIPNLTAAGITAVRNQLLQGTPADTAFSLVTGGNAGTVRFLPNPNTGVANLVLNAGRFRYNSLQTEIRRRLAHGLYFQTNYTFQKNLTDVGDDGINQTRVAAYFDNKNRRLDYSRAAYDTTHIFNVNGLYELPIGKGKKFLNRGGWVDRIIGGWQVTSIVQVASGVPLSFFDARGTLNRVARSNNQTANSSLSKDEIKDLIGVNYLPAGNPQGLPPGVYFIDPGAISTTGRGANGFGSATFPGQVFFNVDPLQTGTSERYFINGPWFWNWDASMIKNFQIKETARFQLRVEAFNLTNSTRFDLGPSSTILNINSTTFGRLTNALDPRIVQFVGRFEF
jgi:carboxypeptidase family protein